MNAIIEKINKLGKDRTPFIFLFDFELEEMHAFPLHELPDEIVYQFSNGLTCCEEKTVDKNIVFTKNPISPDQFGKAFRNCMKEIQYGNSFLLNLTFPSQVEMNYTLEDVFHCSDSMYKFLWKERFVSFSPETFIKIKDDKIYSYPMKGTIDASVLDARNTILQNPKEEAEHYTIVDLIRNDLAQVSSNVQVTQFRYIDEVKTEDKTLLQVSSEIQGDLPSNWNENLGSIFEKLLPAGSISGAPKKKTLEIIKNNEIDRRGFYTGVAGIFDGHSVDSCVLIRFIEKLEKQHIFRSGGGITFMSKEEEEYNELIQKIYVPIF